MAPLLFPSLLAPLCSSQPNCCSQLAAAAWLAFFFGFSGKPKRNERNKTMLLWVVAGWWVQSGSSSVRQGALPAWSLSPAGFKTLQHSTCNTMCIHTYKFRKFIKVKLLFSIFRTFRGSATVPQIDPEPGRQQC